MAKVRSKRPSNPLAEVGQAVERLTEASHLLRSRLAEIDPLDHPARWAGVNDELRRLEDTIGGLRDEQQRLALARNELRPLGVAELTALREATTAVAELVRTAGRIAAVAEAATKLASAAATAVQKLRG